MKTFFLFLVFGLHPNSRAKSVPTEDSKFGATFFDHIAAALQMRLVTAAKASLHAIFYSLNACSTIPTDLLL